MANLQDKERILKVAREKQKVTYKGAPIRLATDFSMETLQARKEWQKILQVMRTRGLQPRVLYPARLSIKIKDQWIRWQQHRWERSPLPLNAREIPS